MTGNAGEVYDSNITFAKSGAKADLISELAAGLKAVYTGKRTLLNLLMEDKEQIYADNSEYTNNSQYVRMSGEYERTKYDRFGITGSFDHYYAPRISTRRSAARGASTAISPRRVMSITPGISASDCP